LRARAAATTPSTYPIEYLSDEVFSLLRCEFCGEDLDAADLLLQDAVDRITHRLLPPLEVEFV